MKTRRIVLTILLCIGLVMNIDAQIVYTDIDDTTINYPIIEYLGSGIVNFDIDLNNDSIIDFCFYLKKWQEYVTPGSQPIYTISEIQNIYVANKASIIESSIAPCLFVFTENDTIDLNCSWSPDYFSVIAVSVEGYSNSCNLPYQDKYYGLSFNIDNNTHYGWLHIDANELGEILLKGYAYNSKSGEFILAGQTEPSIINNGLQKNQIIISCIDKRLLIRQKNTSDLINQVKLYNLSGLAIYERKINDYQATVNLSNVKNGIYIVRVTLNGYVYTKLVFVN